DYGTNKDTTIVYVPFTLGVRPIDRLWLSLTLPYIYQSSEDVVVTGGGVAKRKRGGGGKFAAPERSTSESGLGDMLLRVSYVVLAGAVGSRRAPRRRRVQAREGAEADRRGDEGIDGRCSGLGTVRRAVAPLLRPTFGPVLAFAGEHRQRGVEDALSRRDFAHG